MKRIFCIAMALVLVLAAISACNSGSSTPKPTTSDIQMPGTPVQVKGGGTYWTITPAQLYSMTKQDLFLVNTETEYVGEIQGTDFFVKPTELSYNMDKFPTDKSTKIVIYCFATVVSESVVVALVKAGYTHVMDLQGGMVAWDQQGYPVVNIPAYLQ